MSVSRQRVCRLAEQASAADPPPHGWRLRSSPEARLAVDYARREAEALGADGLGSEHLLLGLLRSGDHPVVEALTELGVEFEAARDACRARAATRCRRRRRPAR